MEIHGAASRQQQQHDGGVKVKFIETQFVSSDAASFKAVVQRLTGQSSPGPSPSPPTPNRPRARAAVTAYPASHFAVPGEGRDLMMMAAPVKQEAGAPAAAARLEDLHELCDFGDLLYTGGATAPPATASRTDHRGAQW